MFEIQQLADKSLEAKPQDTQPNWFDWVIARLGGFASLLGIVLAMGYLIIPLANGQDGSCNYRGEIDIHDPFEPVFAENCLVMGPPISRIATVNLEGYGDRTVQYFEGALLMGAPAGNSQEVEIFPLGQQLQPDEQIAGFMPDIDLFNSFLTETDSGQFLGDPVTSFIQMGDRLVIYYENTSLRWNRNSHTVSHQNLGRDHLLNNYPDLLIEGEVTQLVIPDTPLRFIPGNDPLPIPPEASDYNVNVAVKYPVLYSDRQQVVIVEVINRISNEPVTGLDISGLAQFSDLADSPVEHNQDFSGYSFSLEPTESDGTYVAIINLPDHPDGVAGREVTIDVTFDGVDTERVSAIKKFQTWW